MILVDTSVWIAFFQMEKAGEGLHDRLLAKSVLGHEWIFGELMVGDLGPERDRLLADYWQVPRARTYPIQQLFDFVQKKGLKGSGASLVDVQLIYACTQESHVLWTLDRKLARLANRFSIDFRH